MTTADGGPPRRALISTFGSAGDLFPLVPIIDRLQSRGWEVRIALRRGTGLYLRALGYATIGLGDGSELRVVADSKALSTRFDGWESWRRTVTAYVQPCLKSDLRTIEAVIGDWRPDVVAVSGFAAAARVAAYRASVPVVDLSIYPQHGRLQGPSSGFSCSYERVIQDLAGQEVLAEVPIGKLVWGSPADVLLSDSALLETIGGDYDPVGFPEWDGVAGRPRDEAAAAQWLDHADSTVLVTLGSFLGMSQNDVWRDAAEAVRALGVRGLFIGVGDRWADEELAGRSDILSTGFIPLSRYLPLVAGVVHHGGIGTTFATLRAGHSAVVLPQAFDQTFNARLVERAGVGIDASRLGLSEAVALALDGGGAERAAALAATLTPPHVAADAAVRIIASAATDPPAP